MYRLSTLTILVLFAACSYNPFDKDNNPQDPVPTYDTKELVAKKDMYISMCDEGTDLGIVGYGDAMLFTSLSMIGGCEADLFAFESVEEGRYCRHPDCPGPLKSGEKLKASRWSKDMEVGFLNGMYFYWRFGDPSQQAMAKSAIESHIQYGESNSWNQCGEGGAMDTRTKLSRCIMSTNLKATLYELRELMGGKHHGAQDVPQVWDPKCTGFQCHLTVVHWILRGSLQDGINDLQVSFLKSLAKKHPLNPLYVAAYHYFTDGKYDDVYALLEEGRLYPDDRLPTSSDRCDDYLHQRDRYRTEMLTSDNKGCIEYFLPEKDPNEYIECSLIINNGYQREVGNADYMPCPEDNQTHSGTDYRYVMAIMAGKLKR